MTKELSIAGVETFSMVDYPGQMSAVIFTQGCPWRCPFCHNAELQTIKTETGFIWKNFLKFLEVRKGRLNAVVFSGGEPLMQDSLIEAITEVKKIGDFKIGLHTGGYRPEMLKKVLPYVDWVGFDIKAPLEESRYQEIIQVNQLSKVKESLDLLLKSGKHFECRTTCDPRFLSINDILRIGEELSQMGVKEYYIQQYRPIASDTTTKDTDCEKFFHCTELLTKLKTLFEKFDIRQ